MNKRIKVLIRFNQMKILIIKFVKMKKKIKREFKQQQN